tara:strand:+ start:494 stop:793 length:300 start_codon:yes stop_codon:yes gene_type:complete
MSDQKNKTYLFKFNFAEMPSYRNFKVVAKTDSEAQEKISKEFHQNPYVYLLEGEKVHEKIMRVTFEIIEEGGKAIDTGIPTTSGVTSETDKQLDKVREA